MCDVCTPLKRIPFTYIISGGLTSRDLPVKVYVTKGTVLMACISNRCCPRPNIADIVYDNNISGCITETVQINNCPNNNACSSGCNSIGKFCTRELRLCVNPNGTAGYYRSCCRNNFWPNFCSPRCLPCDCLYDGNCR